MGGVAAPVPVKGAHGVRPVSPRFRYEKVPPVPPVRDGGFGDGLRQPRGSPRGGQRPPRLSACLSAVPAAALLSAALLCPVSAAVLCAARPLPCAPPAHPLLLPEPPRRAPCAAPRSPRSCTPALSICHPRQGGHREVSALLCYASACFCARRNCRGSVGSSPAQRPRHAARASCSASASSVSSAA